MKRPFDDYLNEALQKGWWAGVARPMDDKPTRIYIECGGDTLRRTRGGGNMLLKTPLAEADQGRDDRLAHEHDSHVLGHRAAVRNAHGEDQLPLRDGAHAAAHPERPWRARRRENRCRNGTSSAASARRCEERAKAKGFTEYVDSRGITRRLDNLYDQYTMDGEFEDDERVVEEWVRDTAIAGALPGRHDAGHDAREGRDALHRHRPLAGAMLSQACDLKEDETFCPLRWHVEKKLPYPTETQRAQFYIDHEWFLEADEQLPRHKENPKMGGDYPLVLTTGHNRWSIHAANIINRTMQETNQGRPFMFMNVNDAAERGISEGDLVRGYNDMGDFQIWVKLTPAVRPGQVIVYNGFEPFQFPGWKDPSWIEPGMVKWLHLAGGYKHFRFRPALLAAGAGGPVGAPGRGAGRARPERIVMTLCLRSRAATSSREQAASPLA